MKRRNRQEYQEYDAQTAEAIRNAANRLISAAGAPQKITGREISKVVPHLSQLRRRPEKAPLTSQALEEVLETQEAFTVRRIQWIAQRYLEEQVYPQEWEFLQRVNLRKTTLQNPIIGQAFNDAMITLSRPP